MLSLLRIRNLAVIAAADVEFGPGFTVLTGETGAGKSILVEAVGLLLGARASAELVRTGETVATIEALFDHGGEELAVRREITAQGRSRSFINGALATAGALRDLSEQLVELHGQHEHQVLLDPAGHLPLLDAFAGHASLLEQVSAAWARVAELRQQQDRVSLAEGERAARLELVSFQASEIEKAAPRPGEDEELTTLKQVLASAERVQRLCDDSYASLYESDQAVIAVLGGIRKRLTELAALDPQFEPHVASAEAIKSQLEDLAWAVRDYGQRIEASPERLAEVEERLVALERLKRKYGPTLQDVIERGAALNRERELLGGSGRSAEELERELDVATRGYLEPAEALSRSRRAAAGRFSGALIALLAELAMPRTQFEVRFPPVPAAPSAWGPSGLDSVEFFISPNPGEEVRPLARIASGGELSRIILAIKTLGARGRAEPQRTKTLIFDEVDAGISGQVADVVGRRLQELGQQFQVLCITHLPQIAARAGTQFLIEKTVSGARTSTSVTLLDPEARVDALARLISGAAPSEAVLTSAREMLAHGAGRTTPAKAKGESESPGRGESEPGRRRRR